MALFKKIDKVLAAFGNIKAMERLHVDTVTEERIQNVSGDVIAESEEGIIYAGILELNGYYFLETVILSELNIKTFDGATLDFSGAQNFTLQSNTQEIESDYSNVSQQYMTEISFDITEEEIGYIRDKQYQQVVLTCKKKQLVLYISE